MAVGSIASYVAHATTGLISNNSLATPQTLTFNGTADDSADAIVQSGNQAFRIQNSGRYLIVAKIGWDVADINNNNRHVVRIDIQIGGVSLSSISGRASGFGRDSGAADELHPVAIAYVDHTVVGSSADDITVDVQNFGDTSVALADQLGDASSVQVIRMDDGADWLQVTRTTDTNVTGGAGGGSTTVRPIDSDFQTVSWETQVVETDSAVIEWVSGTDVTVKVAGWYMALVNQFSFTTGTNRQGMATKIMVNDANVNGQSHQINYCRDTDGASEAWGMIPMFLNLAANDIITVDNVRDGETATNDIQSREVCLTVVQLPAAVDIVSVYHDAARAGETTGVFPMDAENSDPNNQHSIISNTDRINGTAAANDWLFFAGYQATTSALDGTRVTEHFRFSRTGTLLPFGDFLGYHRGDQGSNGVFTVGRHGAVAIEAFGSSEWMAINLRHESGTGNQNRDFLANRVGFQGLDLSTLISSSDTEVLASTDVLVLSEQVSSVTLDVNINTSSDTLVLTERLSSVALDVDIQSNIDTLVLSEQSSNIILDVNVQSGIDTLILSEQNTGIAFDVDISSNFDSLTLSEQSANIILDVSIQANADSLILTTESVSVALDINILSGIDALALTTFASTVSIQSDTNINATTDALVLTEFQTSIIYDVDILVTTDVLTLQEFQTNIANDIIISSSTDILSLIESPSTIALDVDIQALTDTLVLAEFNAAISAGSGINASFQALTLEEFPATINYDINVEVVVDSLSLAEFPTAITLDVNISSGVDVIVLTEFPVTLGQDVNINVSSDLLLLTEVNASITLDRDILIGIDNLILSELSSTVLLDTAVPALVKNHQGAFLKQFAN